MEATSQQPRVNVDQLIERMLDDERTRERLRALLAPPPAFTVASLAEALGVSPKVVSNAIRRGELDAVKRGGRWYIVPGAVAAWTARTSEPARRRQTASRKRPLLDTWGRDNVEVAP